MSYGDDHRPTTFGYVRLAEQYDVTPCPGGEVYNCVADTSQTLNIGDTVYFSSGATTPTMKVSKSATAANYARLIAGVVVGGANTYGNILSNDADLGTLAATAGQGVIVQYTGIVKVLSDAAIAAIGTVIPGGTTAGRVLAGTTAGSIIGTALNTSGAAAAVTYVRLALGV